MDNKDQQIWFKEIYDLGDERIKEGYGWPMEPDIKITEYISKIKANLPTGKVLNLGCGQGRHTLYCAGEGFESYGIDYVERAINEAKQEAKKRNLENTHFEVMDLLNLNFDNNFFDIIIDSSVPFA